MVPIAPVFARAPTTLHKSQRCPRKNLHASKKSGTHFVKAGIPTLLYEHLPSAHKVRPVLIKYFIELEQN
tara:strand:- start:128 stop:337 length:210 start_codon:yes stop_codon:yes gene_type:complete